MKKSALVVLAALFLLIGGIRVHNLLAGAGNQYNWGTQNGGAWSTPDDSKTTVGQILQIGSSGGAVAVAGGAPSSIVSLSSAALVALTPGTTGQIAFCNNCVSTFLLVSSGTTVGAWEAVLTTTNNAVIAIR